METVARWSVGMLNDRSEFDAITEIVGFHASGPLVIVGRPHSGSRMLAQFCLDHGVFLGADLTDTFLDSKTWYQRFVVPLILSKYFPDWKETGSDGGLARLCVERVRDTWPGYWRENHHPLVWGWKYCETLFVMPLIKQLFPTARFLHIIRDARDVCLCDGGFFQLTGSHADPNGWAPAARAQGRTTYFDFCCAVTFGAHGLAEWHGIATQDRVAVTQNRFLLQAQAWMNCVSRARSYGRLLGDDYCEVRYEDFCLFPEVHGPRILEFAGVSVPNNTNEIIRRIRRNRMGKWRYANMSLQERRDFANAERLVAPLLDELGYGLN